MSALPFVKAVACGNDFLIIESRLAPSDIHAFTQQICDRHNGIGADGVEWTSPGTGDYDVVARLINADGSDAEVSGNGTRCVAAHLAASIGTDRVRVLTGAGVKTCKLVARSKDRFEFEMNMGKPQITGEMTAAGIKGLSLSMGNPQFVVFTPDLDFDWQDQGGAIQSSGLFPHGVNVDFVRLLERNRLEARFFERGAGATQSSGTGSCASAVAAIHTKRADSPVQVISTGGSQEVRWDGDDVFLRGAAEIIARGEFLG